MPQPRKKSKDPIPNLNLEIAERLKKARKRKGLTQAELADLIGVTREAIAAYESGRVRLLDEIIVRFSVALNVSADELLGLKDVKDASDQVSLRITRRMKDLQSLAEPRKKAILKTLDDLISANS